MSVEDKEKSFFDGIDVSLLGIATLAKNGNQDFLVTSLKHVNELVEARDDQFFRCPAGKNRCRSWPKA